MENLQELFNSFISQFDFQRSDDAWKGQSTLFKEFWKSKILDPHQKTSDSDYDPIIRMLDTKAKGFNKQTDEAVALTYIRQGIWYRTFNDLKTKNDIRDLLNQAFTTENDQKLIGIIDALQSVNEANKNGLTGKNANVLNALLYLSNPDYFISTVSLNHRRQTIENLSLGNYSALDTYGKQVILSNRLVLEGLSKLLTGKWSPRTISKFLYSDTVRSIWLSKSEEETISIEPQEPEPLDQQKSEFLLEKHLEDFLIANWESTSLGLLYDLIEKDGEILSQQYPTDIGKIDLLVTSKSNGDYIVIELKKGQTSDDTVGQVARYMGWVKAKLANGKNVDGIVIAGASDQKLKYALSVLPNARLLIYKVNFTLEEG